MVFCVTQSAPSPVAMSPPVPGTPTSICARGSEQQCQDWIASHHLTQVVDYLPASSFWPLQWTEAGLLLVLAVGLGGLATWRIRRLLT